MTYPNGIVKDLAFDDRSFVTQIKYTKDSAVILQFDYEFDDIGNIIRKTTTWKSGKTTILGYIYDEKNQLIRVDRDGGMVSRYEYDAVGNRLLKEFALFEPSSGGGVGGVDFGLNNEGKYAKITYNYNADNELLSANDIKFEFDKNGNMTAKIDPEKGRTEYTYNRADRLCKITAPDGTETKFCYDARGLRYKKVDNNGAETLFYYGSGSIAPLLSERLKSPASSDESGEPLTSYLPGMSAIRNAAFASGTGIKGGSTGADNTFYHLTDHLGSAYYLTDEKGNVVTENDYDEFGIPLKQISKTTIPPYNPTGYTGEPQHNETDGLVYLRNRFYEPVSGRFTRRDIIYICPTYHYVNNIPLTHTDPSGLQITPNSPGTIWHESHNPTIYNTIGGPVYGISGALEITIYIGGVVAHTYYDFLTKFSFDPRNATGRTYIGWDTGFTASFPVFGFEGGFFPGIATFSEYDNRSKAFATWGYSAYYGPWVETPSGNGFGFGPSGWRYGAQQWFQVEGQPPSDCEK